MATAAPTGFINLYMNADAKNTRRMLTKLEFQLSSPQLVIWMQATVEPWLRNRAKDRFRNEGDDASGKWAPLLGPTQHIRSSIPGIGPAHPINKRTGELEDYITQTPARVTPTAAGATLVFPGTKALGTLHTKVKTAQKGKFQPPTTYRPVLAVNEKDLLAVLTDMALYIGVGQVKP